MKPYYRTELLHVLWGLYPLSNYVSVEGSEVEILARGEYDDKRGRFCGAKVCIDGNIHHGEIVIWAGEELPKGDFESTVVHVAPYRSASILKNNGEPIPQVIDEPDPVCCAAYGALRDGARSAECSRNVAGLERHERIALFTRLMADRLYAKYCEVMEVFSQTEQNWTETAFRMLLRAMGKPYNDKAFGLLASRITYKELMREKGAVKTAEAILFGTAGLLDMYGEDRYIMELKSTFDHYCNKWDIKPLRAGQWNQNSNFNKGIPVLRLAQLAAFFTQRDYILDTVLKCSTVEDIQKFFNVQASEYWSTHYKPGVVSGYEPKKIGAEKANMLGINFIVPMQFAYGVYLNDEDRKEAALILLEKITAEKNRVLDPWREKGTLMENAFDTQAVLQLHKQYCKNGSCWRCPVGKRVVKGVYSDQTAQKV